MSTEATFLERVFSRAPLARNTGIRDFVFHHWTVPGRPTAEAVGILPVPGVDADRFLARVMDVNHYVGNIAHVVESRAVADPAYVPPAQVRFYQRISIPLLGEVHQENVLTLSERDGIRIGSWFLLEPATAALSPKLAIRSQYNDGAWLVGKDVVGYALSSAPRREDVGLLKWKALTAGADVAASKVIRDNITHMARWASR